MESIYERFRLSLHGSVHDCEHLVSRNMLYSIQGCAHCAKLGSATWSPHGLGLELDSTVASAVCLPRLTDLGLWGPPVQHGPGPPKDPGTFSIQVLVHFPRCASSTGSTSSLLQDHPTIPDRPNCCLIGG